MPARRDVACALLAMLALVVAAPAAAQPPGVDGLVLADRVNATDRAEVEAAVAAIERAPSTTPDLAEALRRAARACEDVLADPARALALYERILREFPHGSPSRLARARAELLRERVGTNRAHAREAAQLAELVTAADQLAPAEVERRATELANAPWPGAADAALFHAEWLQRTGRLAAAQRRFAEIAARWPGSTHAAQAIRGAAGVALEAHDWDRADELARQLPTADEADRVLREELFYRTARGRRFDFWYRVAWFVLVGCTLALVGSLLEARRRGGRSPIPRKPPVEVLFLAPVSVVLLAVALTTHRAMAPAVAILSVGGLALAWLSGMTLELLRAHRRPLGLRAAIHAALCVAAVAALAYIVLTHDDLLEMMIETIRFGPDP